MQNELEKTEQPLFTLRAKGKITTLYKKTLHAIVY